MRPWPLIGWPTCNFWCHVAGGRTPGQDIAVNVGTPTRNWEPGRVTIAQWGGTAGNYVEVDEGESLTRYLHLSRIDVMVGQDVQVGKQLGLSGNTGLSDGPHLHLDVGFKSEAMAKAVMPNAIYKGQFRRWFVDPVILNKEEEIDMLIWAGQPSGRCAVIGESGKRPFGFIGELMAYQISGVKVVNVTDQVWDNVPTVK